MKNYSTDSNGFTLVELAIVMVIIGLLIGGILKGQELMQNARVTATLAQVKSFEAAVNTFRDKYDALPGDMTNAASRIPGCNGNVNCNSVAPTGGNSRIGTATWNLDGADWTTQSGALPNAALLVSEEGETVLFWTHLVASDILAGITTSALNGAPSVFGDTHPVAKLGGGFIVGYGNGNRAPGAPAGVVGPNGLIVVLAGAPFADMTTVAGSQVLFPSRAAQIDRKIDDGKSRTGPVQGYGAATCFNGGNGGDTYDEVIQSFDCGLIFRL